MTASIEAKDLAEIVEAANNFARVLVCICDGMGAHDLHAETGYSVAECEEFVSVIRAAQKWLEE